MIPCMSDAPGPGLVPRIGHTASISGPAFLGNSKIENFRLPLVLRTGTYLGDVSGVIELDWREVSARLPGLKESAIQEAAHRATIDASIHR